MRGKGIIYAGELDRQRMQHLKDNVSKLIPKEHLHLIECVRKDARKLAVNDFKSHLFDKILLDAPCSGEGTFSIESPSGYRHWSVDAVNKYAKLQKEIIANAYKLLKPGGELVYSTCTLSVEENEGVAQWFLDQHDDTELIGLGLDLLIPGINGGLRNFVSGIQTGRNDMSNCLRITPTDEYEGFFVCRFRKLK
jgi:16S rRNA C967 or C1407 C5-methylase (RsmB/RsmF family)